MHETLRYKIAALLGHFNISNTRDVNSVQRNIISRKIHKDYDALNEERKKSDADIAILTMDRSVQYTNFIQPICLPPSNKNVINQNGYVAGYGRAGFELDSTKIPFYVQMRSIDLATCALKHKSAFSVLSLRSFCARSSDGIPCRGET